MNNGLRVAEDFPLLLKGTQVAEILGVSPALAYQWMNKNILPVVRITGSRSTRVPRGELLKWIAANTQQPTV